MQYRMLVLATALILSLLGCHMVSAMPRAMQAAIRQQEQTLFRRGGINECDVSQETRDMCERCAKSTKAPVAYKLCCIDEEDSMSWCKQFLGTGSGY